MKPSFFVIFLLPFILFSQKEDSVKQFDSIFYDIAVNVSSANPEKAMHLADSLLSNAQNGKQKIRIVMLQADILEKQERRGEAIKHALKALEMAKVENDYSFQARIYGFLSTQYRNIGFLDKGKESIKDGVAISFKIDNKNQVTKYRAMADQEMAEYAMEDKKYLQAIEYIQLALISYNKEDNEQLRYFIIGNSEELLARAYLALGNKEKALEYFKKANSNINKAGAGNTLQASLIYRGLGDVFLKIKNLDSAEVYIKKAFPIADNGKHDALKQDVYLSMSELYEQKNELDSAAFYYNKYKLLLSENTTKRKLIVNNAYNILNEYPDDEQSTVVSEANKSSTAIIRTGIFFLITFGIYYKRKVILNKVKSNFIKTKISEDNTNKASLLTLSKKTEEDIIQKLEEFETSLQFLDKDMSYAVLVGKMNTNSAYLREILRTNKNKDYASYINDLRINYIVEKLNTDQKYLSYKISYLAEEAGFSTHSKFSKNFKRLIDVSPSEYITSLQETYKLLNI